MQQLLLALVGELNSSVFVLFVILGIVVYGTYRLGCWHTKFDVHDKRVEKIEGLAEKVVSLTTKVDLIYQNTNPNAPLRSNSPLSLTKIGEQILLAVDAENIFSKYSDRMISEVEKMSPNNAYDIQQASLDVARTKMIDLLDSKELSLIKQEAFNRGILVEDVMSVFGYLLRNHILDIKGIPLTDVDKHDPAQSE
ncbi:MAG: hypothetical protein AB7J40_01755 [Candidatus Altimarinota bacterium]